MTLMPVSNISVVGVRSSTRGAAWWMPRRSTSAGSGSPRSIGSPSRLKMRPSVTSPTGTEIGAPVSTTSRPRERPSVVSIATARTRSSPRCCWTSQTSSSSSAPALMPGASSSRLAAVRAIVIAWLISGRRSGKTASITTPWISSMRPTLRPPFWVVLGSVAVLAISFSLSLLFKSLCESVLSAARLRGPRGKAGRGAGSGDMLARVHSSEPRTQYCVAHRSSQLRPSAPATTSMISCVISAWRARFISSV